MTEQWKANIKKEDTTTSSSSPQQPIKRLSDFTFQPNILQEFDTYSYHFNWFMVPVDVIKTFQKTYDKADLTQQVIVAESGVTSRFSLHSIEIESYVGANFKSRNVTSTRFTMQLKENYGLTLFDKLLEAAAITGSPSIYETPLFLHLSFLGHAEDGTQHRSSYDFLWYVKLIDIEPTVDITGTMYTIRMIPMSDVATLGETFTLREQIAVKGVTNVQDFLTKLTTEINKTEDKFRGFMKNVGGKSLLPKSDFFDVRLQDGANVDGVPVANMKFRTGDIAESAGNKDGTLDMVLEKGWTISRIIDAMFANLDFFKDGAKTGLVPKNERLKLVSIPRIITNTFYGDFLDDTQEFGKSIEFVIKPFVVSRILSADKQDDATRKKNSTETLQIIKDFDLLKKRYDYMFSGLNTEVLDVSVKLNALWTVSMSLSPSMMAYRSDNRQSRRMPDSLAKNKVDEKELEGLNIVQLYALRGAIIDDLATSDRSGAAARRILRAGQRNLDLVDSRITQSEKNLTSTPRTGLDVFSSSGRLLLETTEEKIGADVYQKLNIKPRYELRTDPPYERYTITATQPDIGVHKRITVLEQAYERDALVEMEMTIKGDPYWLGPTASDVKKMKIADDSKLTSNAKFEEGEECFYFDFITPAEIDDESGLIDFKKSSAIRGVYSIYEITSTFDEGKFTQKFKAYKNINIQVT
jgi:hypothetical protein